MVLLFSSCKKEEFVQPDYIVFGAIQGNCDDGCRFVYYLDNTKLAEDETAKYFSPETWHLSRLLYLMIIFYLQKIY